MYNQLMNAQDIFQEQYRVLRKIGVGGTAVVYEAFDKQAGRFAALKILRTLYQDNQAKREQLKREAHLQARIHSDYVVKIYDYGESDKNIWLVMEYVPGRSMWHFLQDNQDIQPEMANAICLQTCEAVGAVHRAGIIHCDIKPLNFLMTPDKHIKLSDFGEAIEIDSTTAKDREVFWASPLYMAPEQIRGERITPATDIYSLGIILFRLYAGQLPFYSEDSDKMADFHLYRKPEPPSHFNRRITAPLDAAILKCLQKDPQQRFATISELLNSLRIHQSPRPATIL